MREWLYPVFIEAMDLDDAWWLSLRSCFKHGHEYKVTHGSYEGQRRFEFDYYSALIREPWKQLVPLMPESSSIPPPASKEQCETYMADYLYTDFKSENEDYRYGERIVNPRLRRVTRPDLSRPHELHDMNVAEYVRGPGKPVAAIEMGVNQFEEVVRKFAHAGGEGTNQCTIEIAMPNDILLNDPPCLRLIDCRIRYGRLHFVAYFRSWDLYAGFPVNLGGLELLKQLMVDELNAVGVPVDNGCLIVNSKGLHVYEQYYELVEDQLGLSLDLLRGGIVEPLLPED
jgi:thymidylate synthase